MKMMNKPRMLRANEIEVRVAHSVGDKKYHLLYIDSRAVTKYLDEWVGWNNWQTEFYPVNNQIVGRLGIWDDIKQMWIWKSNVGSESNIEKDKGLISDTYKRLLVRFGITELYSAPDILLPDDGYGNKGYKVSEIAYNDNREIIHLVLVNKFNKEVFRWYQDQISIKPLGNTQPVKQATENYTINSDINKDNRDSLSNEDKLIAFRDMVQGKVDDKLLTSFVNFYMKLDSKKNNGKSIADNWIGSFAPQKRFDYWLKKNRNIN